MKEAIVYQITGECELIKDMALKKWNMLCHVIKYQENYTLVEYSLKGKTMKVKAAISKEDAIWLIETFNLKYLPNSTFNNSGSYLQC